MAAALALAVSVSAPGVAAADPSPAKARAKLVKLNEQADQIVEKYNQATETYKKAGKKYAVLNAELKRKSKRADTLREDLIETAVSTYQAGPSTGLERLVAQGDPGTLLGSMAAFDQIAQNRAATLRAFEATTKELRDRHKDAQKVLAEAEAARDKVRGEKAKADKMVAEQTKLLRRLGAFRTGDPNSKGIEYTGPASGNAGQALRFAFSQVGKPYRYGGTGPGSYDCSGLTQAAWGSAGVKLPRTTWSQWSWGAGRRVPLDSLEPGDLLFSKGLGHMGMYAGGGKMLHAPQTGDIIKLSDIDGYWRPRLLGAIRP